MIKHPVIFVPCICTIAIFTVNVQQYMPPTTGKNLRNKHSNGHKLLKNNPN